jgi:hypothetical protein
MARSFYVNGEASVACNLGSGLAELGISVDGVSITIDEFDDGIQVDTFGPHVFGEYQYFLLDAIVKAELVFFDPVVIDAWLTGLPTTGGNLGTYGNAGVLLVSSGAAGRLLIRSTPGNAGITGNAQCWNFPYAYLLDSQEIKIGTVRSTWNLTWKAVAAYQPSTSTGAVLFNTTCS